MNDDDIDYLQGEQPLHDYLRGHARRHPDKAALLWYGRAISYAELDRWSDAFALALHERGVAAVHLTMVSANTPARAFYDRLGFHEIAVPDPGPVTYLGRSTAEEGR